MVIKNLKRKIFWIRICGTELQLDTITHAFQNYNAK